MRTLTHTTHHMVIHLYKQKVTNKTDQQSSVSSSLKFEDFGDSFSSLGIAQMLMRRYKVEEEEGWTDF